MNECVCLLTNRLKCLLFFAFLPYLGIAQSDYKTIEEELRFEKYPNKWNIVNGNAKPDTAIHYEGKYSMRMFPSDRTTRICQIFYPLDISQVEVDSITFSGKYKYENARNAEIIFGIQKKDSNGKSSNETTKITPVNNNDWADFHIKIPVEDNIVELLFATLSTGDIVLWIDDIDIKLDNKSISDKFIPKADQTVGFTIPNIYITKLRKEQLDNIEALGKIWGFLKYYHPSVTAGQIDWDIELFKVLPLIIDAKKKDRNKTLLSWIQGLNGTNESYNYVVSDSSKYSRFIDLNWINNADNWGYSLKSSLESVKNAKRNNKFNYYIAPFKNGYYSYDKEKIYPELSWDNLGGRLLALFRFWNAIEYCFPYTDLTDKNWKSVLREYIPKFIEVKSPEEYDLVLASLVAQIKDTHGGIRAKDEGLLAPFKKENRYPATLRTVDEQMVIESVRNTCELKKGDIILQVEGKDVKKIVEEQGNYISTSNTIRLWRHVGHSILNTNNDSLNVTIQRDGQQQNIILKNYNGKYSSTACRDSIRRPNNYNLAAKDIAYFNSAYVSPSNATSLLEKNIDKKGIILDLRFYHQFVIYHLASQLSPFIQPFTWFSFNENSIPGNFKLKTIASTGKNKDYYKGKVAILVDEGTLSRGEFTAMGLRKLPNSVIIGSTTAGADGDVAFFPLPDGKKVTFTGTGTYYPEWELCQRKGVKIDIEVKPTLNSIKEGRDLLIEKAIEYIIN
ncbi:MAG: S41 family peptidase [Dysgonomonas sp.]